MMPVLQRGFITKAEKVAASRKTLRQRLQTQMPGMGMGPPGMMSGPYRVPPMAWGPMGGPALGMAGGYQIPRAAWGPMGGPALGRRW